MDNTKAYAHYMLLNQASEMRDAAQGLEDIQQEMNATMQQLKDTMGLDLVGSPPCATWQSPGHSPVVVDDASQRTMVFKANLQSYLMGHSALMLLTMHTIMQSTCVTFCPDYELASEYYYDITLHCKSVV